MTYKKQGKPNPVQLKAAILGVAVGDALGVPVEFEDREYILEDPVTGMRGHGTHYQPAGTWSDDTSLTLCLAEALIHGFDLSLIAQNFMQWAKQGWWTPYGDAFDIGVATSDAIERLVEGVSPENSGATKEYENGNGSLMRILPLVFYVHSMSITDRFHHVQLVSSITHGHIRSVIACFYYVEFAKLLLDGSSPKEAYQILQVEVPRFLTSQSIDSVEIQYFHRILSFDISLLDAEEIESSGYVVHTLEASLWCLLTSTSYAEAVLKAVNLGDDTDTTAAVTGGLAGLYFGLDQIPVEWIDVLARKEDILDLAQRWSKVMMD